MLDTPVRLQRPDAWLVVGHSFFENQFGTQTQAGRTDAAFRNALDVEFNNWKNLAVTGSQLMKQGAAQGGYARAFQLIRKTAFGAPYVGQGGGLVIGFGLNDYAKSGPGAAYLAAFQDALRAVIARHRAASIRENDHASITWGAGFALASNSQDWTSGTTYRTATTTTNATFTITIPTDYTGTPIVICYNGIVNGGTVTYSGTAGVTGTFSTSNIIPASESSHCPKIHRIKTLTAANAGQTIIGTVTALTAGGTVDVDYWSIEAENPPPIIVCDIARLPAAGYAGYPLISGNSEAVNDAGIVTWNDGIQAVIDEFDSMVARAFFDAAIGKNLKMVWELDRVHPNEFGAGKLAGALVDAVNRLYPAATTVSDPPTELTTFLNSNNFREGSLLRHMATGKGRYYAPDARGHGTAYTPVVGDLFLIPQQITIPNGRLAALACEALGGTAAGSIRWGVYDDPMRDGYPFTLMTEPSAAAAFVVSIGAGAKATPAFPAAGSIDKPIDPGIIWFAFKVITTGTGITYRTLGGPNNVMSSVNETTGIALGTGVFPMGYKFTGQGTTALPTYLPLTGAVQVDNCPMVSFKLQ